MNTNKTMPKHIIVKLLKTKDKLYKNHQIKENMIQRVVDFSSQTNQKTAEPHTHSSEREIVVSPEFLIQ